MGPAAYVFVRLLGEAMRIVSMLAKWPHPCSLSWMLACRPVVQQLPHDSQVRKAGSGDSGRVRLGRALHSCIQQIFCYLSEYKECISASAPADL